MRAWEVLQLLQLVLRVAFRNLWLYRVKTIVIGALLGFGAFLAVIGLSLLHDVEGSMRDSVTDSIAGHLQIYSNKAKDDLSLFGSTMMGREDIGTMPDFVPYRDVVLANPNVAAFVPMGQDMAILGRGNEMDDALDALRAALKAGDPALTRDRVDQLRYQMRQLDLELVEQRKLLADQTELDAKAAALATAEAPGYLDDPAAIDEAKLQFLETKIAPISGEKPPIYFQYVGTDVGLFRRNFSKFKVLSGEPLPEGRRGIMLSSKVREEQLKNLVARLFDRLEKSATIKHTPIAGDEGNERDAADLPKQYAQIESRLDRAASTELSRQLDTLGLHGAGAGAGATAGAADVIGKLTAQLKEFLTIDDQNLQARYKWFYANIAPKIRLYEISPGETITLRNYTRSGYVKSLPLKVYGVYGFDGLEDSDLAGGMNIIDLVSFRELYGQMADASRKELADMRAQVGAKTVDAAHAEDELFGAGSGGALESRSLAPAAGAVAAAAIHVKPVISDAFDPKELQSGLALNAAVRLKDPDKLEQTRAELETALKAKGYDLRVVDWQQASGMVGQFVNIVRLVLIFALVVIFIVALVIINNSIIVGTLNRFREIGTMRAIGAQKSFVVGLFLAETGITGLIGAVTGTAAAVALLLALHRSGIPAGNDVVAFLFSGPRLYPTLRWPLVALSPLAVTAVATAASIYAARHAARVQPAEAMQEKE